MVCVGICTHLLTPGDIRPCNSPRCLPHLESATWPHRIRSRRESRGCLGRTAGDLARCGDLASALSQGILHKVSTKCQWWWRRKRGGGGVRRVSDAGNVMREVVLSRLQVVGRVKVSNVSLAEQTEQVQVRRQHVVALQRHAMPMRDSLLAQPARPTSSHRTSHLAHRAQPESYACTILYCAAHYCGATHLLLLYGFPPPCCDSVVMMGLSCFLFLFPDPLCASCLALLTAAFLRLSLPEFMAKR